MARVVNDIRDLLLAGGEVDDAADGGHLWDERVGAVLSGRDYSDQTPVLLGVTGPELPVAPVDF